MEFCLLLRGAKDCQSIVNCVFYVFQFKIWRTIIITDGLFCRGVRQLENIQIPEGIGFPEEVEIPDNFENPATVSPTTLQCCIAAYKICIYTVQFLLPVKLLETRILRIV